MAFEFRTQFHQPLSVTKLDSFLHIHKILHFESNKHNSEGNDENVRTYREISCVLLHSH